MMRDFTPRSLSPHFSKKDGHSLKNTVHCVLAAMSENGENFSVMTINPTKDLVDYELAFENIERNEMMIYRLSDNCPFKKLSDFSGNII